MTHLTLVELSCTIKKIKLMRALIFGRMVVHKEKINDIRSYIFVEWLCANKRNTSMKTLIFGRMVVHKESINERR